jgi:hypothetical protein
MSYKHSGANLGKNSTRNVTKRASSRTFKSYKRGHGRHIKRRSKAEKAKYKAALFACDAAWVFVVAQADKARVSQVTVWCPLLELDLCDLLRLEPTALFHLPPLRPTANVRQKAVSNLCHE